MYDLDFDTLLGQDFRFEDYDKSLADGIWNRLLDIKDAVDSPHTFTLSDYIKYSNEDKLTKILTTEMKRINIPTIPIESHTLTQKISYYNGYVNGDKQTAANEGKEHMTVVACKTCGARIAQFANIFKYLKQIDMTSIDIFPNFWV